MPAKVYYDDDANLALLKNKIIAILGYGSQGHAQAQNLRDSGCSVIVGQRKGSPNYDLAVSHGFKPMPLAEATESADIINILNKPQWGLPNTYINSATFGRITTATGNRSITFNARLDF